MSLASGVLALATRIGTEAKAIYTALALKPTVVVHGATGTTSRPTSSIIALWIGSATPVNATTNDLWWDTTNKILKYYNGTSWISSGSSAYKPLPAVVVSLTSSVSAYHQAPTVILQGTFVAPASTFRLSGQISGVVNGAAYSGMTLRMLCGIPVGGSNNCGGILGEEVNQQGTGGANPCSADVVGTALYPVAGTGGVRGATVKLGVIVGEFATGCLNREVIYSGAVAGTTYTVQLIADGMSGLDQALAPSGSSGHTLSGMVITPTYDTSSDYPGVGLGAARDLWVLDTTAGALLRYSIGRRSLAAYEGIQPRLLYKGQLVLTGQTVAFGRPAIDRNGIICVGSPTAATVTLVDTTQNSHAGAVGVTSAALGGNIDDIVAAPDGSGFWVAVHNVALKKIHPTTGAVLSTVATAGYQTMHFALTLAGDYAYVWTAVYGIVTIKLSDGTTTTGPSGPANVNCIFLSPDGLSLILGSGNSGNSYSTAKLALSSAGAIPTSSAVYSYTKRLSTTLTNQQIYSIGFSADSKMFFACGLGGLFYYAWLSNGQVFDGITANNDAVNPVNWIAVTPENDGIYIASSGGTTPAAKITAYPGTLFTCDPVGTNNGMHFAEIQLA